VRRAPNEIAPQLWVDWDAESFTNASSFRLLPPDGGFTDEVTERMISASTTARYGPPRISKHSSSRLPVVLMAMTMITTTRGEHLEPA
jgi:hypothetical protein